MKPEIEIFGPIGDDESGVTVKTISDQLKEIGEVDEIKVRISSEGGSVTQGIAIANLLKNHPAKIHTIIEGGAYSMAGYLACCGDRRTISSDALLHVHGPQLGTEGNLADHEDSVKQLRIATNAMVDRYAELSGQTTEDIEKDFQRDLFYDAEEAITIGYMTDIGDESQVVAEFDPKKLPKIPKRYAAALARSPESKTETGEEEMPKTAAASLKEMKSAFRNASSDFLIEQIDAEASLEDATAAYIGELENTNKALKKTIAKLEANAEMDDEDEETETPSASNNDGKDLLAQIKALLEGDDEPEEEVEAEEEEDELTEAVLAMLAERKKPSKKAKASKKQKRGRRLGAQTVRTSSASRKGSGSARSQFNTLVAQAMKEDSSTPKHILKRQVLRENPELREQLNEE